MLHDRLVGGIQQLSIQQQLLPEPTLTLKRALELVLKM